MPAPSLEGVDPDHFSQLGEKTACFNLMMRRILERPAASRTESAREGEDFQ